MWPQKKHEGQARSGCRPHKRVPRYVQVVCRVDIWRLRQLQMVCLVHCIKCDERMSIEMFMCNNGSKRVLRSFPLKKRHAGNHALRRRVRVDRHDHHLVVHKTFASEWITKAPCGSVQNRAPAKKLEPEGSRPVNTVVQCMSSAQDSAMRNFFCSCDGKVRRTAAN